MGQQSRIAVAPQAEAADTPPVQYRVVTECADVHHVFAVMDGSEQWWHWLQSFTSRFEAETLAAERQPWKNWIFVDLARNEVTINGLICKLTGKECEILAVLAEPRPRPIAMWFLIDQVWKGDESHISECKVYVSRLRKLLAMTPFKIETIQSKGFALVERSPDQQEIGK